MLRVAAAALSVGLDSAQVDSEAGQNANTQFIQIPGFLAQLPVQNAPAVATAQNGQAVHADFAQSSRRGAVPTHQGNG